MFVIRFPETPEFPIFSISGKLRNSDVSDFWKLQTPTFSDIFVLCNHSHFMSSLFTCDSVVSPCFMLLFSFMYSGLLSVPGTYLSHSLVYKYLYSVARKSELRLLSCSPSCLSFPSPLRDLEDLSLTRLLILPTHYSFLDLEILESRIPTLPRTQKSRIPEGFHREQGNTLSPPR